MTLRIDRRNLLKLGSGGALPRIAQAQSSKTIRAVMHAPLRISDPRMC
jgi:peptide/nickel transport system substrate-binding protein